MKETLEELKGKEVVVDTASNWVYIGTLDRAQGNTLVLKNADAHDITDTEASKEFYIFDTRTTGIKVNRDKVYLNLDYVVGVSPLEAIMEF